jgi:type II secretory ATPase GspE/PulE/Tfp pilus assembly ATPase PilB-like protein
MVGEIRDLETAEIAIQAALNGHLVFSTRHTNDAPGAITRLEDMGAEPYLLSSVIEGVVAQRLVRRICARCRVPHEPSASDLLALGIRDPVAGLYRGAGCDGCRGTGYRGRTGIYELLSVTEDVRSLILRRASSGEIRRHAVEQGQLRTLREDGWAKAMAGVTTVEELLRVIQEDS